MAKKKLPMVEISNPTSRVKFIHKFEELNTGVCFKYNDRFFQKIDTTQSIFNAINLKTGELVFLNLSEEVVVLKTTIFFEYMD